MFKNYFKIAIRNLTKNKLHTGINLIGLSLGLGVTNQLILQKNKELSVRKILGASPIQILNLISGEYLIWLAICFGVGIPFSYFILSGWLKDFQIQISLGFWFFTIPALTILLMFLITTFYQTAKAVFINPSEILKDE